METPKSTIKRTIEAVLDLNAKPNSLAEELLIIAENLITIIDDLEFVESSLNKIKEAPANRGEALNKKLCNILGPKLLQKWKTSENDGRESTYLELIGRWCLDTDENRDYFVTHGLEMLVTKSAEIIQGHAVTDDYSPIAASILATLFAHSSRTCSQIIQHGGLDAIVHVCAHANDDLPLRHAACALANLALYGEAANQEIMTTGKFLAHKWLLYITKFNKDEFVTYNACLAIAVLIANEQIDIHHKDEMLRRIETLLGHFTPSADLARNVLTRDSVDPRWLRRLIPTLRCNFEEAKAIAALHFLMVVQKSEADTTSIREVLQEIGAVEALAIVAGSFSKNAAKWAGNTLGAIGVTVPPRLSVHVPLWTTDDICLWLRQIQFADYEPAFVKARVDGDLLLTVAETTLCEAIGMDNTLLEKRFIRELNEIKIKADYSSQPSGKSINCFLQSIGSVYCAYTYPLLKTCVNKKSLHLLYDDILAANCEITNRLHRAAIMAAVKKMYPGQGDGPNEKWLDVFLSYRRSNGGQLASLLQVHLQLRGYSVFLDVDRLTAGKFDEVLIRNIKDAKYFVLVLTKNALDRCVGDDKCLDWIHREISAAIKNNCTIVPITYPDFEWPSKESLPEDIQNLSSFNAISWSHEYQTACIDKIDKFIHDVAVNNFDTLR